MSEITTERKLEILQSLGSTNCEGCGGTKKPKMSHCRACYYRLPQRMRGALYRGFGDGYEEAYEDSLEFLRRDTPPSSAPTEKPHPTCRRCPAPIIFAQQNPTERNPYPSSNPLNAKPHPNGNLRLDRTTMKYDVLTGDALKAARDAGEELYLSHFVDCPFRQKFGKKAAEASR